MVVNRRSTRRTNWKCGCCVMHKSKARCAKGRDAERRMLKRRERAAWKAEVAADA